jgi:hypothetical protein
LRILYGFLKPWGREFGFLSGFRPYSFIVYSNFTVEICKRLRQFEEIRKRLCEFEEIKSQGKAEEVTVNSKEETLKNFVWISFQEIGLRRFSSLS